MCASLPGAIPGQGPITTYPPHELKDKVQSGKKETNKHKHFGRDGVRDKQEPSLGQTDWDPYVGQTGRFLFNSTVRSPFCPVWAWDGWGSVPGTIVPQGPSDKCLCVVCLLLFSPPIQKQKVVFPCL